MEFQLASRDLQTGPALLAIRPNRIRLLPEGSSKQEHSSFRGTVLKSTYVGNHMEYRVQTEFGEWFATSDDIDHVFNENQPVDVQFAERGPVLLPV